MVPRRPLLTGAAADCRRRRHVAGGGVVGRAALAAVAAAGLMLASGTAWAERRAVVILHTNDIHSHFLPTTATWRRDRPQVGGFLALDAMVRAEREAWKRVLVLDGGDVLTGTPLSELVHDGVLGSGAYDLMARVGYDAGVLGNHEFDHGPRALDELLRWADRSGLLLLCANLRHPDGRLWAHAPGHVFDLDGVRVGVVGLITEDLPGLLHGAALRSFRVESAARAARQWIDQLDPRPDVVVALTHLGVDADVALARAVPDLDVIVGGHSHTRLTEPRRVGNTLILQAGTALTNVGWLRLEIEDGAIVASDYELRSLLATDVQTKGSLGRKVAAYAAEIREEYGAAVATLKTDWRRHHDRDSNVGSWLAEALADAAGTDFGLLNSGGIRKDVPAGPVTRLDVVELLPFRNEVCSFEVTGRQLLDLLLHNAEAAAEGSHGVLQLGYLTSRWCRRPDGGVALVHPTVRGRPIEPAARYRGASVDYVIYSQPERYLGSVPEGRHCTGRRLSDVIEERLRRVQVVDQEEDGRLTEVEP